MAIYSNLSLSKMNWNIVLYDGMKGSDDQSDLIRGGTTLVFVRETERNDGVDKKNTRSIVCTVYGLQLPAAASHGGHIG